MFNESITQLTTTTTNHANNFNAINNTLLANDIFLRDQHNDLSSTINDLSDSSIPFYDDLPKLGLSDANMSLTDMSSNLTTIIFAMPTTSRLTLKLDDTENQRLRECVANKLRNDLNIVTTNKDGVLDIFKYETSNAPIAVDFYAETNAIEPGNSSNARQRRFWFNANRDDLEMVIDYPFRETATTNHIDGIIQQFESSKTINNLSDISLSDDDMIADNFSENSRKIIEALEFGQMCLLYINASSPNLLASVQLVANYTNTNFYILSLLKSANNTIPSKIELYPNNQNAMELGFYDDSFLGFRHVSTTQKQDILLVNGWEEAFLTYHSTINSKSGNQATINMIIKNQSVSPGGTVIATGLYPPGDNKGVFLYGQGFDKNNYRLRIMTNGNLQVDTNDSIPIMTNICINASYLTEESSL